MDSIFLKKNSLLFKFDCRISNICFFSLFGLKIFQFKKNNKKYFIVVALLLTQFPLFGIPYDIRILNMYSEPPVNHLLIGCAFLGIQLTFSHRKSAHRLRKGRLYNPNRNIYLEKIPSLKKIYTIIRITKYILYTYSIYNSKVRFKQ